MTAIATAPKFTTQLICQVISPLPSSPCYRLRRSLLPLAVVVGVNQVDAYCAFQIFDVGRSELSLQLGRQYGRQEHIKRSLANLRVINIALQIGVIRHLIFALCERIEQAKREGEPLVLLRNHTSGAICSSLGALLRCARPCHSRAEDYNQSDEPHCSHIWPFFARCFGAFFIALSYGPGFRSTSVYSGCCLKNSG